MAERYHAGSPIEAGTVVLFGGEHEIEASNEDASTRVAGVISTAPAFMMNKDAGDDNSHPYVALAGRVPCKVIGLIQKGDMLVASGVPGHAVVNNNPKPGTIIGKAVGTKDDDGHGIVEVVIGRV